MRLEDSLIYAIEKKRFKVSNLLLHEKDDCLRKAEPDLTKKLQELVVLVNFTHRMADTAIEYNKDLIFLKDCKVKSYWEKFEMEQVVYKLMCCPGYIVASCEVSDNLMRIAKLHFCKLLLAHKQPKLIAKLKK